jgi:hypothetical protein
MQSYYISGVDQLIQGLLNQHINVHIGLKAISIVLVPTNNFLNSVEVVQQGMTIFSV